MEAELIKFLNTLYSSVDENWTATDSVPELVVEGFKELYPLIAAMIAAWKTGSGN